MRRIMLVNSKGGCGKTTIATNLAGYYAASGISTLLIDHDPQGSSMQWLSQRSPEMSIVRGVDVSRNKAGITRSWQLYGGGSGETEVVILDTPAGIAGPQLVDLVRNVDVILIPVMASHIDIYAVARFIQELLLMGKARVQQKPIGIIANRVQERTLIYHALECFLARLDIPLVTRLRDTQNYIHAIKNGLTIFELRSSLTKKDRDQWQDLIDWLDKGCERLE